jgi:hypothetical protein
MSRSRERSRDGRSGTVVATLAAVVVMAMEGGPPALAQETPTLPPDAVGAVGAVEDIVGEGLSRRRAEIVRSALAALLAGARFELQARGFGERRPKLPNVVSGKPIERNRARNRRVEIIFTVKV